MQIINQLKTTYQFQTNGIFSFVPKINLRFEVGPYTVKTAETFKEVIACFKLRDEVFNKEFRGVYNSTYDFDEFDSKCDHIIIIHNLTNSIVGTYRLNSSLHSENFYSAQEFEISSLKVIKDPILELGRACIHKEHRRGAVIALLWKGIAEYMNLSKSKYLIGCTSIKISKSRDAALVYQYLYKNNFIDESYSITPMSDYQMSDFAAWLDYFTQFYTEKYEQEAEDLIPSLLKSYLRMGAKIIAEPAFDQDYNCVDYLTLLQRDLLAKSAVKKYGVVV